MSERIQKQKPAPQEQKQEAKVEPKVEEVDFSVTDELLDEIDGLLEENAEDFVKAYIQKGGE